MSSKIHKMKIRMTFIVTQHNPQLSPTDDDYFKFFLSDNQEFPSCYMSTHDEYDTLKALSGKYFHVDFEWFQKELYGFRRVDLNDCEVVYTAFMPEILGSLKSGRFYSDNQAIQSNIELDPYYEEFLLKRGRSPIAR